MALQTKRGRDLPEGSVKLTEQEALNHQESLVNNWPSALEVFFLRNGPYITGASATISSGVIINHFRRVMNIDMRFLGVLIFPGAILPGCLSYVATKLGITQNILLMKSTCPVCQQLKFAAHQCFSSLVFPAAYAITSCGMYALATKKYPFPNIISKPAEHWKEYWKLLKTGTRTFQYIGILQAAIILFLPMMQSKELFNIMANLNNADFSDDDSEMLRD